MSGMARHTMTLDLDRQGRPGRWQVRIDRDEYHLIVRGFRTRWGALRYQRIGTGMGLIGASLVQRTKMHDTGVIRR